MRNFGVQNHITGSAITCRSCRDPRGLPALLSTTPRGAAADIGEELAPHGGACHVVARPMAPAVPATLPRRMPGSGRFRATGRRKTWAASTGKPGFPDQLDHRMYLILGPGRALGITTSVAPTSPHERIRIVVGSGATAVSADVFGGRRPESGEHRCKRGRGEYKRDRKRAGWAGHRCRFDLFDTNAAQDREKHRPAKPEKG